MHQLIWFRADLRVEDNPALWSAMQAGPTVAIYTLCDETWKEHRVSPAKISLMVRQLRDLERSLSALNVPLRVIHAKSFEKVPAVLKRCAREFPAAALYFNHEFEINERRLSKRVAEVFDGVIPLHGFNDQCAIAPGQIRTGSGDWYKVFTPFKRRYLSEFAQLSRRCYSKPQPQKPVALQSDLQALRQVPVQNRWETLWPAGEAHAQQRLKAFASKKIQSYAELRDHPCEAATSALSPYLAVGALSTRQCMDLAIAQGGLEASQDTAGASTWMNELIWREFYRHLIYVFPDLCKHRAFQSRTEQLPWKHDATLLRAWQQGETGYPIVDAAMQQLLNTGWMHNRLRMITAMFLTKHLFIDWRLGEDFFMQNLVDGDLASNNGGWQWSASTGVDAAPYFRIFNPARQSERFDPSGRFIKQYLPQLKALSHKQIHSPSPELADACGYPRVIVDHRDAVAQTKAWFQSLG